MNKEANKHAITNGVQKRVTDVVTTTTTIAPTTTTTEAPTTTTTKPGLAFTGIDVPRQLTSMLLLFATGGLFLALVRRRILRGH